MSKRRDVLDQRHSVTSSWFYSVLADYCYSPWLRFISFCSDTDRRFVGTSPSIFSLHVRRNDLVFLKRRVDTGHDYDTTCFLSTRFSTASGLFSSLAAMWTKLGNEVLFGRVREIAKSDYSDTSANE